MKKVVNNSDVDIAELIKNINKEKDISKIIDSFNSVGDITFCSLALDKTKIVALVKNNNNYGICKFGIDYDEYKHLRLATINQKEHLEDIKTYIYIISTLKKAEVEGKALNLPDYYFNLTDEGIPNVVFGWDLEKRKTLKKGHK